MERVAIRSGIEPRDFLAWEREQPARHEFWEGEIFAMAGGTPRHAALASRVGRTLGEQLGKDCEVFSADLQIGVADDKYVYADATVVCGRLEVQPGTDDVARNPSIIVEVLSKNTEQYDRGAKWDAYQRLQSVTDYVLVSQVSARVEHFSRGEGGAWVYRLAEAGGRVTLSRGVTLDVDVLFDGVFALPGE